MTKTLGQKTNPQQGVFHDLAVVVVLARLGPARVFPLRNPARNHSRSEALGVVVEILEDRLDELVDPAEVLDRGTAKVKQP